MNLHVDLKNILFSLQFILLFTLIDFKRSSYAGEEFPIWTDVLGWCITIVEITFIPGVAIYKICTTDKQGSIGQVSSLMTLKMKPKLYNQLKNNRAYLYPFQLLQNM